MTVRLRKYTTSARAAVAIGALTVVRAPALLLALYLLTIAVVTPFALVLGGQVQSALAGQQVLAGESFEIDAEWWVEFERHARGLEASFTPAVAGIAGPLSNLTMILDGQWRDSVLLVPILVYTVLWMFAWGGVIERFRLGRAIGVRSFISAGATFLGRFLVLAVVAAGVYLLLYLTVHPLLFSTVFPLIRDEASTERSAFLWRVALYGVFGALLVAVNLIVEYTRVFVVLQQSTLLPALGAARRFVLANLRTVLMVHLALGLLFAVLVAGYGAVDILGGSRVGGWRAVALGQLYIFGRLAVRLTFAASAVALVNSRTEQEPLRG